MKKQPERIPYDDWINSMFSIAQYYGGCTINGKSYYVDYDNCPTKLIKGEIKYFPDLVEGKKPVGGLSKRKHSTGN